MTTQAPTSSRSRDALLMMESHGFDVDALAGPLLETYGVLHDPRCPRGEGGRAVRASLRRVLDDESCGSCLLTMKLGVEGDNSPPKLETWIRRGRELLALETKLTNLGQEDPAGLEDLLSLREEHSTPIKPGHDPFQAWSTDLEQLRAHGLKQLLLRTRPSMEPALADALLGEVLTAPSYLLHQETAALAGPLNDVYAALRDQLRASPERALVSYRFGLHLSHPASALFMEYYALRPDLLAIPLSLLPWLRSMRAATYMEEVLLVPGATPAELEALTTLHDPRGDGAFTTLTTAWAAARAL